MRVHRGIRTTRATVARALLAALAGPWLGVLHAQLPAPAVSAPGVVHLGGYASVVANAPDTSMRDTRIVESSLALLASGTLRSRLGWFAELDLASSTRENYAGRQDDRVAELERLYAEYTTSDALRVRVGRFLTPIGQWNESHAEPLTWTAVRPLTTYRAFAKRATGLLIAGDGAPGGHDAGYALYLGAGDWVGARDSSEVRFASVAGGRVAMEVRPGVWLGASGAAVRQHRPVIADDDLGDDDQAGGGAGEGADESQEEGDARVRPLLGVDARLLVRGIDVWVEAIHLGPDGPTRARQQGGFVQAAIPVLGSGVSLVGRGEWYSARPTSTIALGVAGLTWRPRSWITLKLERDFTAARSQRVARGWHAGLSLLF